MNSEIMYLKDFLKIITANTKLHVCIHDVNNIFALKTLELDYHNTIHYGDICNFAKTTKKGLQLCLNCKSLANKKSILYQKPFWGRCPWGITEYVLPVLHDKKMLCIIYLGNICDNKHETERHMRKAAKFTGVDTDIINKIPTLTDGADKNYCEKTAHAIKSYILLLYQTYPEQAAVNDTHWIIKALHDYADAFYNKEITVTSIANLYGINKKYAGRVFKNNTGMSFSEYLNTLRINAAKNLLITTKAAIIDISLEVGYNSTSYFNRVFKNLTGCSPNEYRKKYTAAK